MSRLTALFTVALAAFLVVASPSFAGGFATAGLSSLPEDVRPGDTWIVDVTLLGHGVTPLEGVDPRVMIEREGGANAPARAYAAKPTRKAGVYRARVEFPSKGFWAVSVDDGFAAVHEFGGVRIGEERTALVASSKFRPNEAQAPPRATAPAETGSGVDLGLALALAALAGLMVAAMATGLGLRRRPTPAGG